MLRSKFLFSKEVTRGVYHRLRTSADRRMSRQRGTYIFIKIDLNHMRELHVGARHRLKASVDRRSDQQEDYRLIRNQPRPKANIRPPQSSDERGEDRVNSRSLELQKERL